MSLAYLEKQLYSWIEKNPGARNLPPHLVGVVEQIERHRDIEQQKITVRLSPADLEEIRETLNTDLMPRAERRRAEVRLADYIDGAPEELKNFYKLVQVSEKLRNCRQSGAVGVKPGGGHIVAWDSKCNLVRLCPDESREETQRLAEKYIPAMSKWLKEDPRRRIFYAVFTDHNFRPDQLATGKKYLFDKFKDFCSRKIKACPVSFYRDGYGMQNVKRSRKKNMGRVFDSIKGSLVIQEDPLSAGHDWNIHLNVFLMVEGPLDYKQVRQEWGANVEIRELKGKDLTRAMIEAVKYSAQIVPTKSEEKKQRHETDAPAMIDWPYSLWVEWWSAQQGFRRTRSYGCLYKVDAPETDPIDMSLVEWIGTVKFLDDGSYRVDLIPGDNFSSKRGLPGGKCPDFSYFNNGPPG